MSTAADKTRRAFLRAAGFLAIGGCASTSGAARPAAAAHGGEAEVTAGEDLMQEHGLLERILLVYEEGARRIERAEPLDLAIIGGAAGLVQRFVEQYHEQQEEQHVFPRLRAAQRETGLVATLLQQHERGRLLTQDILRRTSAPPSPELAARLRSFARMYRPHAAREDTVLFPAFREVVGKHAYHELGEQFEDHEHALFGEHGFETNLAEVARLEAALGIGDLASFTPPA